VGREQFRTKTKGNHPGPPIQNGAKGGDFRRGHCGGRYKKGADGGVSFRSGQGGGGVRQAKTNVLGTHWGAGEAGGPQRVDCERKRGGGGGGTGKKRGVSFRGCSIVPWVRFFPLLSQKGGKLFWAYKGGFPGGRGDLPGGGGVGRGGASPIGKKAG